jgi:transcriptional regulator with XRE-family HTH domain
MLSTAIGSTLRKLRNKKKLSQTEVADFLKVSQATYCTWEAEKTNPSAEHLPLLAEIFEVSIPALYPKEMIEKIMKNVQQQPNTGDDLSETANDPKTKDGYMAKYFNLLEDKNALLEKMIEGFGGG